MNDTLIDAIDIIGIHGGESNLSDAQVQSLQSLIDDVSFKVTEIATRRSTVEEITSEMLRVMNINGVRNPLTFKLIVSKVVEWELDNLKENFRTFSEGNSFSLQDEMNVSDLLSMLPARKEVRDAELKKFAVVYTVGNTSGYDIIKCTEMTLNESFAEFYNDGELVAFITPTILFAQPCYKSCNQRVLMHSFFVL